MQPVFKRHDALEYTYVESAYMQWVHVIVFMQLIAVVQIDCV